jgi:hypothetical protein
MSHDSYIWDDISFHKDPPPPHFSLWLQLCNISPQVVSVKVYAEDKLNRAIESWISVKYLIEIWETSHGNKCLGGHFEAQKWKIFWSWKELIGLKHKVMARMCHIKSVSFKCMKSTPVLKCLYSSEQAEQTLISPVSALRPTHHVSHVTPHCLMQV